MQVTTDTGGGYNIGYVQAGEYLDYTVNVASAGNYRLELRGLDHRHRQDRRRPDGRRR